MTWDVILLVPMTKLDKGTAIFYFFGSLKIAWRNVFGRLTLWFLVCVDYLIFNFLPHKDERKPPNSISDAETYVMSKVYTYIFDTLDTRANKTKYYKILSEEGKSSATASALFLFSFPNICLPHLGSSGSGAQRIYLVSLPHVVSLS